MGGAFNSGILATGAVEGAKFNYEDASEEIMARTRKLEAVCAECGVSLAAAALQFSLAHPAVTTVIPGCKSVPEAERSIETMVSPRPRGGRCLLRELTGGVCVARRTSTSPRAFGPSSRSRSCCPTACPRREPRGLRTGRLRNRKTKAGPQ